MEDKNSESSFHDIVGDSPALNRMLRLAMKVAATEAPVLILGEAGSGKESIARAIHRISSRRNASFVKVNCAMTANERLESDLFGSKKAEGRNGKVGYLELAHEGILLLDEIALLPLHLQVKLLQLLERPEFEGLGSVHTSQVNVRLIVTTRYDLGERVAEQTFLGDLYDQLNVFPVQVPPLRERREDIPILARYFMQMFARRMNKPIQSIPAEAMGFLMNSDWPGNVRELENLIERSVISTEGPALRIAHN